MKFTKKCNSNTKIQNNRRRSSAGMFYTSSAGAVTSLILMLAFSFVFNIIGVNTTSTYADSINLSIDTDNLVLNFLPSSTAGTFSSSSDANISVSTTSASGYTLSIASSSNNTSLTNSSDSSTISSIESAIDESTFSNSANTTYNNKWGYKPSSIYNSSTEQNTSNSNFRPLPGSSGEILAVTSAANSTANNYTLSFGARVNSSTSVGTYSNNTYVITAVANIVPLTIVYNANGGYFGSNTSTTTNTVNYDATCTSTPVTKYSHTSNINDAGTASGTYPASQATKDVVTIPGAEQLNVTIYYSTYQGSSSSRRSYVYAFEGEYTGTISSSTTGYLERYYGGTATTMANATQDTFTVTGDTVTFGFYSTSSSNRYYGYYAVVTGSGTTCSKTAIAGSYATPNNSDSSYAFRGWSEDQNTTTAAYANESEVSSKLIAANGDSAKTLYAVWGFPAMQNLDPSLCSTTPMNVRDARDDKNYTIQKLADDKCWMTTNLNLAGGTALSADDTDVSSDYISSFTTSNNLTKSGSTIVLPASQGSSNFNNDNYSYVHNATNTDCSSSVCYGYYSWDAATLGSGRSISTSNTDAPYSICPKGWKLPNTLSNENDPPKVYDFRVLLAAYSGSNWSYEYNTYTNPTGATMYERVGPGTTPNFQLGGQVGGSSVANRGYTGYYWSATSSSSTYASYLSIGANKVTAATSDFRRYGQSVRCVMRPPAMQDVTSSNLASMMPNVGDTTTLSDSRDGKEYTVAKLADGKYWMTTNLNLAGGTALSADDTDVTSDYISSYSAGSSRLTKSNGKLVLPASSQSGFSTANYSYVYNSTSTNCSSSTGCYGYYSWDAATLGSGRSISTDNTDAPHSICPKGWKLPTAYTTSATNWQTTSDFYALAHQYGLDSTTSTSESDNGFYTQAGPGTVPNFLLAGSYGTGSFSTGGSRGYYWSSTSYSDTNFARYLDFGSSFVSSANSNLRYYGQSVRCIKDLTPTMQEVTAASLAAAMPNDGDATTLKDSRDDQKYSIAKINDNYWMTRNLAIGCNGSGSTYGSSVSSKSLTSSDSNVSSSYSTPTDLLSAASGSTQTADYSAGRMQCSSTYGAWYNYYAASAGTVSNSSGSATDATKDICPAGWRLPTKSEQSGITSYSSTFLPTTGGSYYNGAINNSTEGYWWSATAASNPINRYHLIWDGTSLDASIFSSRNSGEYVRCIKILPPSMQNATTSSLAAAMPNNGNTTTLPDERDGQIYSIAKIGNYYWMTRNLAIGCNGSGSTYGSSVSSKSLTSSDSNVSSSYSTPTDLLSAASSSTQTADYSAGRMQCNSTYGAWYNFYAASAGTISGQYNSIDATEDICPKGWHIPTKSQYDTITSDSSKATTFSSVAGGYYYNGSRKDTTYGWWWTSTKYNSPDRYGVRYDGSTLSTVGSMYRYYGLYVRCIKNY